MSKGTALVVATCVIAFFASTGLAVPLSVTIADHDFLFDVPFYLSDTGGDTRAAVYDYAGAAPDVLRLTASANPGEAAGEHNVASYRYSPGAPVPQVPNGPPVSPSLYPLYKNNGGAAPNPQFGAKLELVMYFDTNDGPYTNGSDTFDVSLTGTRGYLTITGWIGSQTTPFSPVFPVGSMTDITLLHIEFSATSLLARAGNDVADLVEGFGRVTTILGADPVDIQEPNLSRGVTFFKFMLPDPGKAIFPVGPASYDPLVDYPNMNDLVYGAISGEAGLLHPDDPLPEPGTMSLLGLGGLLALRRRRRA